MDSEVGRTGEAVVTARTDVARTVGLSSTREFTESDTSLVVVDNNCKDGVDSDSEVDCTGEKIGTVWMLVVCSVELNSTRVLAKPNTSLVVVGSNSKDGVDSDGADAEVDCTGENTGTVRMLVDCSVELSSTRVLAESNTSLVVVGSNSADGVDSNGADSEADTDTEPE